MAEIQRWSALGADLEELSSMTAMLVIWACLATAPDRCGRISILVTACTAFGQAAAAEWVAEHPQYVVHGIVSCEPGIVA